MRTVHHSVKVQKALANRHLNVMPQISLWGFAQRTAENCKPNTCLFHCIQHSRTLTMTKEHAIRLSDSYLIWRIGAHGNAFQNCQRPCNQCIVCGHPEWEAVKDFGKTVYYWLHKISRNVKLELAQKSPGAGLENFNARTLRTISGDPRVIIQSPIDF